MQGESIDVERYDRDYARHLENTADDNWRYAKVSNGFEGLTDKDIHAALIERVGSKKAKEIMA